MSTGHIDQLRSALADRYLIERELGQGGMATVYLAEDVRHHRKVAVKVLRPELAASMGPDRFLREIEIAAQLQHPHILPLLDSGDAAGFLYYVMPYVQGESLRDRLVRERELPVHDALRIITQVADALAHAHEHGVVHRDIKPENILLSGRHALVADFGVAKAVSEATGRLKLTSIGVALGTPTYMAPEQASADPGLDHRVDIYALGVVAYELLAGRPPFTGNTAQQVLAAHMTRPPEPIRGYRPSITVAVESLVLRCLEKHPADRWQSTDELLAQLEPLAASTGDMTPTQTRPLAANETAEAAARAPSRQFPRWLAWLLGGALVSGGAFAWAHRHLETPALALGKRTVVALSDAWEWHPSLSPDGRLVSYTVDDGRQGAIFVQQVDGGAPVRVAAGGSEWRGFGTYSPDGTKLLFLSDSGLEIAPALGGQSRLVVQDSRDVAWGAWAPAGDQIAFSQRDTLFTQRLDDGRRTPLAWGSQLHSPAWSSNGEWIAYVLGNDAFHWNGNLASAAIWVIPASGGSPVRVTEDAATNLRPVWLPHRLALLFISDRDGGRDIYQQELTSSGGPRGGPVRLTTGLNPEWISLSADGSRLAWSVMTETANVWSLPISRRDSAPLSAAVPVTSGSQSIENFSLSRDGRWLYFDSDRGGTPAIWRQPVAGGEPERLSRGSDPSFSPAVSPDGREVVYHAIRSGNRDIMLLPSGGGPSSVVSATVDQELGGRWSPDGQAVGWFVQGGNAHLMLARRDQAGHWTSQRIGPPGAGNPDWSPDGRALVHRSKAGLGVTELGSNLSHDLVTDARAGWPLWSPDSRTIFYTTADSTGAFVIRAVSRSGGAPRTVAYAIDPLRQAQRSGFEVTADRLYFVLIDRKADVWVADVKWK